MLTALLLRMAGNTALWTVALNFVAARLMRSSAVPILVLLGATSLLAGPPAPFPEGIPPNPAEAMFRQFFDGGADLRGERQEDDAALARIAISPREEKQYGDQAARAYLVSLRRRGIRVTPSGPDAAYLRALVDVLQPQMENARRYPRLQIHVSDSDQADAFAFPGGTLVFSRGMIDFAGSEAALVGVVGHELSHLDHGHQLRDLRRWKFAQQTFSVGQDFSPEQFLKSGTLLMKSFMRPFRPEDESEADRDGATWAYNAGYDPRAIADLFSRMAERARAGDAFAPAFLRTHPYSDDRRRDVLKRHAELVAAEPRGDLFIGVENLRTRTPRDAK